jgi:hypothetical protein
MIKKNKKTVKDVYCKIKPREWFIKYAFKDYDNCWWKTEEEVEDYEILEDMEYPFDNKELQPSVNEQYIGEIVTVDKKHYENIKWAVDFVITKKKMPEYFI